MFRTILIGAMFATAAGYCFAAQGLPQIVTSEVFYKESKAVANESVYENSYREPVYENSYKEPVYQEQVRGQDCQQTQNCIQGCLGCQNSVQEIYQEREREYVEYEREVPAWPISGSDADVQISETNYTNMRNSDENIRIVSKIGADLVVENNFNLGAMGNYTGWSGGANMLHGAQVPAGFDNCDDRAEMPLLYREMLEDDGGEILSVARSNRKRCGDRYVESGMASIIETNESDYSDTDESYIDVDLSADAEAPTDLQDQVRSWVVASGQTLREVLQNWCDKEGWDLVWTTPREYPIEASAVFKGRFVDVSSALVRNFGRATPIPYAKFYKGNRVLVISTTEE